MTAAIKIAVVLILGLIIFSLVQAAIFLIRDGSNERRVVRALTVRISLSLALFVVVIALFAFGVIEPNDPFQPRHVPASN